MSVLIGYSGDSCEEKGGGVMMGEEEYKDKTEEKYGIIYKIKNKVNNKRYIGQTIQKQGFNDRYQVRGVGIERVYNFHRQQKRYGHSYNSYLLSSIEKYGKESFEVQEEFDVAYNEDELIKKEIFWIDYYKTHNRNFGYNFTMGGEGNNRSAEHLARNYKKLDRHIICLETKEVYFTIKEASEKTGVGASVIGRNLRGTQEQAGSWDFDEKFTFKYIDTKKRRPVICVTTGELFLNANDAMRETGVHRTGIYRVCTGEGLTAGRDPDTNEGLIWRFQVDHKISQLLNGG